VEYRTGDVPHALRRLRDEGRSFDLVILDPPRFVAGHAQKRKGLRAYKDINLMALKLLADDGILATFSCSGLVSEAEFRTAVAWAAQDAGRTLRIVETLGQPADHPVLAPFPESGYLKGLIGHVQPGPGPRGPGVAAGPARPVDSPGGADRAREPNR
jgi:23S rRNA (cytosine1962-C5)-methyltransferase